MEEEADKGLGFSSKTEARGGEEDGNKGNSVTDDKHVKADDVASGEENVEKAVSSDGVEKTDAVTVEENPVNGEHTGEVETVISDDKANCEVEDSVGVDSEATTSDKSQQSSTNGEDKVDQEKEELANESGEVNKQMDVGSETKDANHSESTLEPTQLRKGEGNLATVSETSPAAIIRREEETTNVNQEEEDGEAMEIDYAAEEHVPIAEADRSDSNVVNEMEIDETKDNADMETNLAGAIESADSANPSSLTEDATPGEVEQLDHNGLFDPSSDITNFIDFSGVSFWSGNIQDLKTESGNVSLKENKNATDMAEEVATEDCNEALKSSGASVNAESRDENQGEKDHQSLDQKTVDQQDTRREEDDTTHEAPSTDPTHKEDTVMKENPSNSDCADVGTDSDIKANGVKRKADVLSEDSFKIGACIARAASQMAESSSVFKGSKFGDETLSLESFVSQLHCAATDPVKENVVSEIAAAFFLDFRNSSASQQYTQKTVSRKGGRPSNSNAGVTKAFEYEEMGDTYRTDRVIQNGGEEQTPPTEKENYQVVPVEVKPAEVKTNRRRYRRRQSEIGIPLPSESDKPADFDENAPAELIMNFSKTDTIPPEKSLSKMFRHFGPIMESQTEVDKEKNRARVVFRKGADAEVAYKSAGRFNIFGTKTVNYELNFTITETFKVQPYVASLGEEEAMQAVPS